MSTLFRFLTSLFCISALALALTLPAAASEPETEALTLPPAVSAIPDSLPDDLVPLLPDGLLSPDADDALAAAETLTDWSYLLRALLDAIGLRLGDAVGLLATLIGLLLIAAVLARLREAVSDGGGELVGLCLRLVLFSAIITQTAGMVQLAQDFFASLRTLTAAFIPAMGALYAMGGNLGEAAVSEEILLVFLAVCEYVSTAVTPPVCAVCMAFSLMDAIGTRPTLAPLSDRIKRGYATLLGLVMFLLSLALATQSVLAGRADSLGMRGVKYAVGTWIPIVGGAVSGTLGTVAEGVSLLRSITGISGVLLVALLLLPTLVCLLLFRWALHLASIAAALLGCDGEARLLDEMASLHGYLAAAAAIASVLFILALTLLLHGTAALA